MNWHTKVASVSENHNLMNHDPPQLSKHETPMVIYLSIETRQHSWTCYKDEWVYVNCVFQGLYLKEITKTQSSSHSVLHLRRIRTRESDCTIMLKPSICKALTMTLSSPIDVMMLSLRHIIIQSFIRSKHEQCNFPVTFKIRVLSCLFYDCAVFAALLEQQC